MKVLVDRCIGRSIRVELERAGHDAIWVGDWPEDPGDPHILAVAYEERRVLITTDKDFGGLAVVHGLPHAGMIRLHRIPARQQATVCLLALSQHASDLDAGAIVTIHQGRIRVRRPDRWNGDALTERELS